MGRFRLMLTLSLCCSFALTPSLSDASWSGVRSAIALRSMRIRKEMVAQMSLAPPIIETGSSPPENKLDKLVGQQLQSDLEDSFAANNNDLFPHLEIFLLIPRLKAVLKRNLVKANWLDIEGVIIFRAERLWLYLAIDRQLQEGSRWKPQVMHMIHWAATELALELASREDWDELTKAQIFAAILAVAAAQNLTENEKQMIHDFGFAARNRALGAIPKYPLKSALGAPLVVYLFFLILNLSDGAGVAATKSLLITLPLSLLYLYPLSVGYQLYGQYKLGQRHRILEQHRQREVQAARLVNEAGSCTEIFDAAREYSRFLRR